MYDIYMPAEDSFLLLKEIKNFAFGDVLDVGTGSGILAFEAAKSAREVIGVDLNERALDFCRAKAKKEKIKNIHFVKSDLFQYFIASPKKFDLIIFNPPYLPLDEREPIESRLATTGGKKGYELLERFFDEVSPYLKEEGKILILFSSLTKQERVHNIMEERGYNYQKLTEMKIPWEDLFVYVAEKSNILIALERDGFENIRKLAKGHRGIVFVGDRDGKKIAVKQQRKDIDAIGRIANEARWLKVLNKKGVGPKFLYLDDDMFAYEFVKGEFIEDFMKSTWKGGIKKVLIDVFKQCFELDKMNVSKEEMHNPYKHVIVKNEKPVLIDFERTHYTERPQNVTQFCQYITSGKITKILKEKSFKIDRTKVTTAAKRYKDNRFEENFEKILSLIK